MVDAVGQAEAASLPISSHIFVEASAQGMPARDRQGVRDRSLRGQRAGYRPHPDPSRRVFTNSQRNYERYPPLACAEAQNGNTVAAENYYQHAEHYFRSMRSNQT